MKIGLLLPQIGKGGAERAATRISKILSENHEVFIIVFAQECEISYDYCGKLIELGVKSTKGIINKWIAALKRIKNLKKLKKELKLDAVISFMQSPNYVNVKSKVENCKTIVSIRNFIFVEKAQDLFSKLELKTTKNILKKSDLILCVSKEIKDSIISKYGNLKSINEKTSILYNPYDIDEITCLKNENYITNKKNSDFYFCAIGRLMHQKGFWHLIKSFYLFSKKHKNAKLFIIGQGNDKEKIEDLIKKLNLEDNVTLLGQMDNPFKVISKCDVYVLSSLFEGFPNALVEAMACGLPVIASNCQSGPKEILDDKSVLEVDSVYQAKYGIIYKNYSNLNEDYSDNISNEHQILANAMELLYSNEELRNHYKQKSLERAKMFSYDAIKQELEKILKN